METNLQIEEIRKKYERLKVNVYDYSGAQEGAEDFAKFKESISDFENNVAPSLGFFPEKNWEYWIIKTALVTCYAGSKNYKEGAEREQFMDNLLTTMEYNPKERKLVLGIIEKSKGKKDKGLEGIASQI
jgi:hypothetical protein